MPTIQRKRSADVPSGLGIYIYIYIYTAGLGRILSACFCESREDLQASELRIISKQFCRRSVSLFLGGGEGMCPLVGWSSKPGLGLGGNVREGRAGLWPMDGA